MTPHLTPGPTREPLAPLRRVVLGILLVAVDLNIGRLDVLLDPVGYLVVASGLRPLVPLHHGFGWARGAAFVGVVTSTVGQLLRHVDPSTGAVVENPWTSLADTVLEAVVVVALCTALLARSGAPGVLGPARVLRWMLPAVSLAGGLLALVAVLMVEDTTLSVPTSTLLGGGALAMAVPAVVLLVAGIVLGIWFLVVLWRASREPDASFATRAAMIPG